MKEMPEAKDHCGLFGVFGSASAVEQTYTGLFAQQHRGQESAGIVSIQDNKLVYHKGMGLVSDVFTRDRLDSLKSHAAIGHVRYSTTGASNPANAQPFKVLEGHNAWVEGVVFTGQGTRLATVGADQTVRLWDLTEPPKK